MYQQHIFKVTFGKTVVTLLYVNKISSNFSNLFQVFLGSVLHSKEVSINPKKTVDDRTV